MAVAVTAEIAKKAAHLAWNDLPDDLVERTKQCLLDWFAVTVAGAQDELTDILIREAMEDGAKGPASLVGRSEKTAAVGRRPDQRRGQPRARLRRRQLRHGRPSDGDGRPRPAGARRADEGVGPAVHRELRRRLRDLGPRRPPRRAQPLPERLPRHRHGRLLLRHRRGRPHARPERRSSSPSPSASPPRRPPA